MKKGAISVIITLMVLSSIFFITTVSAEPCNPEISIINQDPYPAIPGDYVKVVFQIDGLENKACGTVTFGVKEDYPISLDPNTPNPITINSGLFQKDYGSFYLAPYKLRISDNALDGENPIEIFYSTAGGVNVIKDFNITVEDTRADFEITVKDYDYTTRILTFEILNVAKSDVKAIAIDVPQQSNIEIKGPNRNIVGDLDSNEYTTADFEAILPEGVTNINLNVSYTDSSGIRRWIEKTVQFDSSYFTGRDINKKKQPYWLYIVVILVIAWFVWRRMKKKKREAERKKKRAMM